MTIISNENTNTSSAEEDLMEEVEGLDDKNHPIRMSLCEPFPSDTDSLLIFTDSSSGSESEEGKDYAWFASTQSCLYGCMGFFKAIGSYCQSLPQQTDLSTKMRPKSGI